MRRFNFLVVRQWLAILILSAAFDVYAGPLFTCDLGEGQTQNIGCTYLIVDGSEVLEAFKLKQGESHEVNNSLAGETYCWDEYDYSKPDDWPPNEIDQELCSFQDRWVNAINSTTDPYYNKPIPSGHVRFHCDAPSDCRFTFADAKRSFDAPSGSNIDVIAKGLGTSYCANWKPTPAFDKCEPKFPLRPINDDRGQDFFTRRPQGNTQKSIIPPILIDHPEALGICVLTHPRPFNPPYDVLRDGFPIGYFVNTAGRLIDVFSGFPDQEDSDRATQLCAGKWSEEVVPGKMGEYKKIPDFAFFSNQKLRVERQIAGITYYLLSVGYRCNAPAPGILASRCENDGPLTYPKDGSLMLPGFVLCKTEATYPKRDQQSGAGWSVYQRTSGLSFNYWIQSESKTFQGGNEIISRYVHTIIPADAKQTLGPHLKCDYVTSGEVGQKNGDWKF